MKGGRDETFFYRGTIKGEVKHADQKSKSCGVSKINKLKPRKDQGHTRKESISLTSLCSLCYVDELPR